MKVLFSVSHPADFLLFKNVASQLVNKHYNVLFVTREKEVLEELVKRNGFKFISIGLRKIGFIQKALNLLYCEYKFYKIVRSFKPDLILSHSDSYAIHGAYLLGISHISMFANDSLPKWVTFLYRFLPNVYFIPNSCRMRFPNREIRYQGNHELAYLHPRYFTPNSSNLQLYGFSSSEKFIILRFVKWDALDDYNKTGFTAKEKKILVSTLQTYAKIIIFSEPPLPRDLLPYSPKIDPTHLQDFEHYATLMISESGVMSSESAILGTPTVFYSPKKIGFLEELEVKYGLLIIPKNFNEVLDFAKYIFANPESKNIWYHKRIKFLQENEDITDLLLTYILEKSFKGSK